MSILIRLCHLALLVCLLISPLLSASAQAERPADQIYKTYCITCHASGVANAPKFGNQTDWLPHIEKGMSTLLLNTTKGINAMPPKGLCFDCSDAELQHTIQYMIDNSQG